MLPDLEVLILDAAAVLVNHHAGIAQQAPEQGDALGAVLTERTDGMSAYDRASVMEQRTDLLGDNEPLMELEPSRVGPNISSGPKIGLASSSATTAATSARSSNSVVDLQAGRA